MTKTKKVNFILAAFAVIAMQIGFLSSANAGTMIADEMTCKQAVGYYEKYKLIYVVANHKDVVPIYGMKPKSTPVYCGGHQTYTSYWVDTVDKKNCVIAHFCR